jgi:putative ABC transport system permease protein
VLNYHFKLALISLRRNIGLTSLVIVAIGVGVATCITTLSIYRAMSANPIPTKSSQLFSPQIDITEEVTDQDNANPAKLDEWPRQLTYMDAIGLMRAHAAKQQAAMYVTSLLVRPADQNLTAFQVKARATYAGFFAMFEVPFQYGGPWNPSDDTSRSELVVISRRLNELLYHGSNSVQSVLNLGGHPYRIIGVIDKWAPLPKFYDVISSADPGESDDVFLPFPRAIESAMPSAGEVRCENSAESGWQGLLRSECIWIQFWVELDGANEIARYRNYLSNYSAEQQQSGRFRARVKTRLWNVQQWLIYMHVVTDDIAELNLVAFSFLLVCLLNATALLLAKNMARARDFGVRRALGASSTAILTHCVVESTTIGLVGAVVGLAFTAVGLWSIRELLSNRVSTYAHLQTTDFALAVLFAFGATFIAGLYPAWWAARVNIARQVKA